MFFGEEQEYSEARCRAVVSRRYIEACSCAAARASSAPRGRRGSKIRATRASVRYIRPTTSDSRDPSRACGGADLTTRERAARLLYSLAPLFPLPLRAAPRLPLIYSSCFSLSAKRDAVSPPAARL